MAFLRNKWVLVSLFFACLALTTSLLAGYYWLRYTDIVTRIEGILIHVNIGVDYGNETRLFRNDTETLTGATLFDVTKQTFSVSYNVSALGTEVISINNVRKQGAFGWTYWIWNPTGRSWSIVWENADGYMVSNRETFLWYYQSGFEPPP